MNVLLSLVDSYKTVQEMHDQSEFLKVVEEEMSRIFVDFPEYIPALMECFKMRIDHEICDRFVEPLMLLIDGGHVLCMDATSSDPIDSGEKCTLNEWFDNRLDSLYGVSNIVDGWFLLKGALRVRTKEWDLVPSDDLYDKQYNKLREAFFKSQQEFSDRVKPVIEDYLQGLSAPLRKTIGIEIDGLISFLNNKTPAFCWPEE